MKKILITFICLFSFISFVKAFDIDVNKIDIDGYDSLVIDNLNKNYVINSNDFVRGLKSSNSYDDIINELVKISLSDDKDNKLSELSKYVYIGENGGINISSSLFLKDFVDKINNNTYSYEKIKNIKTVDMDEGVLVFAYIDDVKINDDISNMTLTYWLVNDKVRFAWFTTDNDIKEYFKDLSKEESNNNTININKSFMMNESVMYDELNTLYENNKLSNVSITGMVNNGVSEYGSGFFLRSGVVATSWELFNKMLDNNSYIIVNDCNGNTYSVDGVIAANNNYDIVLLKLDKNEGQGIKLGNSSDLKYNDNVFIINSFENNTFSIKYGSVVNSSDGKIKSLFPLNESQIGSALYNKNGEVIGFNTGVLLNSDLSLANDISYLNEIYNILINKNFNDIEITKLNDFKSNYYEEYDEEEKYNNIGDNVWNIYKRIGNIEDNIKLELVKGSYQDNIVSLRYKLLKNDSINSMYLINNYESELINEGYEIETNNYNKKIYQNDKYKIVIKTNMNYLIIIIMEK